MVRKVPIGFGYRKGAVGDRSQIFDPKTNRWVKWSNRSDQFIEVVQDYNPFKGVRKAR